ncbi:MAG: VOC family protein [Acidimicrobiia bacterium]
MISGAHVILYSTDTAADRAFFRDVLEWPYVDAGDGWLIFGLPPAEIAVHPTDGPESHEVFFMCDDVDQTMAELTGKGVEFTEPVTEVGWGRLTRLQLPGGGTVGVYEPRHPRATDL